MPKCLSCEAMSKVRKPKGGREQQILQYLEAHPGQNYTEIAKAVGLSEGSTKSLLLSMIEAGKVGRIQGLKRYQHYSIRNCGNGCLCGYCRRKLG